MLNLLFAALLVACVRGCYWNAPCPYQLFGSKTPYDTVRGDIRDYPNPANCEAVSIWSIFRHGNRNPGASVTVGMRAASFLKEEIIKSWEYGNSELCAQDIDEFRKWTWNHTLDISASYLTGTGYEELYNLGKRIRQKYSKLINGTADKFYFRPTNEQRTITSCGAFVHGFTDGTDLAVTVKEPRERDNILRPYEHCDRYQLDVRNSQKIAYELEVFFSSPEFIAVQSAVQKRLGLKVQLNSTTVFSIYELCRFYRSWSPDHRSPWCAVFTEQDLIILEFFDDVRHYYRNGYGASVNAELGRLTMKDLYETFASFPIGGGRKVKAYFTHDTMMQMVFSALGLYKDDPPQVSTVHFERVWRSSYIGAFSINMIAVLNRCNETDTDTHTYRVQIFINEKPTPLCPLEGCSWLEFLSKFKTYSDANLEFCNLKSTNLDNNDEDYISKNSKEINNNDDSSNNHVTSSKVFWSW